MSDAVQNLHEAIRNLLAIKPTIPPTPEELAGQMQVVQCLRVVWSALPSSRIKERDIPAYIREVIGVDPSDEHVSLARSTRRSRKITLNERLELEERQHGRCALCGVILNSQAEPHVDHIIPIVLGGEDDICNFQLLCAKCNLGKSSSLHWLMILPFFNEAEGQEPTASMRYTALKRFQGRCGHKDCNQDSTTDRLEAVPYRQVSDGGRVIFDNLIVLCADHAKKRREETYDRLRRSMRTKDGRINFSFQ